MFELHGKREAGERTAKIRAIKEWARQALRMTEDATVMVTELRCTEPGCPPLETVVAVLRSPGDSAQFKIHKAMEEVVYEDIEEGAARMLRGGTQTHR